MVTAATLAAVTTGCFSDDASDAATLDDGHDHQATSDDPSPLQGGGTASRP